MVYTRCRKCKETTHIWDIEKMLCMKCADADLYEKTYVTRITLTQEQKIRIFFEGHEFLVEYDDRTNENLKMKRVI